MDFYEQESYDDLCCIDPFVFDYVDPKGCNIDCSKAEFDGLVPPSVTQDEPYNANEGSMRDYCKFAQVLLCLFPMEDIEYDFDLGVEFDSDPSYEMRYTFILHKDRSILCYLMMKKDLLPELLRWYLLMQGFNFMIHHKRKSGDVQDLIEKTSTHTLSDPELV